LTDSVSLHPEVQKLAKDFALTGGKVSMPMEALEKWDAAHAKLSPEEKQARGLDLVALAARFQREGGIATIEAVGQIAILCSALLGRGKAKQAFKSAGVGWGPKAAKGTKSKGWGQP
jgi:hypothetical protein